MRRICPNCGREMSEYELGWGPGGMGCVFCGRHCPRCGREVFEADIIHDYPDVYCVNCRSEYEEEKRQKELEEELDSIDDEDEYEDNDSDELDNLTKEELEQRLRNQKKKVKDAEADLRKANIEFLKRTAKANGEPIPEDLDNLTDEELNAKVKPLIEKFLKGVI